MPKKVVQTIILLLLLVVLPILSWVFLRDGLNYRIDARARLTPKTYLPENSGAFNKGKIQVLYSGSSDAWESRLSAIASNFNDRKEILLFGQMDTLQMVPLKDSLQKAWHLSGFEGLYENAVFLIDTTCAVTRGYELYNDQDMAALTQDIAFLLPIEKDKDFLVKREREK